MYYTQITSNSTKVKKHPYHSHHRGNASLLIIVLLYSSIHSLVIITFASVHPSYAALLGLSLIGCNRCVESWLINLSKSAYYTSLSLALRHL